MHADKLRQLATQYLVPFFSGAKLLDVQTASTKREMTAARTDPCVISFKVSSADDYRLRLWRSQSFDDVTTGRVTETHVVRAFVEVLSEIEDSLDKPYAHDLLTTFQRKVIVRALVGRDLQEAILYGIDVLSLWASRLYEGHPITAAIGFESQGFGCVEENNPTLEEIAAKDFSAVLSNGYDTMLSFDRDRRLVAYEALSMQSSGSHSAPLRYTALADWSTPDRIVLALNRLGEILVFKDKKLVFARRSGKWHFLTHEPVISQMGQAVSKIPVRMAVYESCLDASFARTGACLGIVTRPNLAKWKGLAKESDDYIQDPTSTKTKAVSRILAGRKFHELDRRARQELLAIDGATLIDYLGNVLAVGAILDIRGGSDGGGRKAAAKALAIYGLGIKVSQDGGILGFAGEDAHSCFYVM
jgi:hypothetical protein